MSSEVLDNELHAPTPQKVSFFFKSIGGIGLLLIISGIAIPQFLTELEFEQLLFLPRDSGLYFVIAMVLIGLILVVMTAIQFWRARPK